MSSLRSIAMDDGPFLPEMDKMDLHASGNKPSECRAQIMKNLHIGLTRLYKEFQNPWDAETRLVEFRELQAGIDRGVAAVYPWGRLDLDHDFHEVAYLLDKDRLRFSVPEQTRFDMLRRRVALKREQYQEDQAHVLRRSGNGGTMCMKKSATLAASENHGEPSLFDAVADGKPGCRRGVSREGDASEAAASNKKRGHQ